MRPALLVLAVLLPLALACGGAWSDTVAQVVAERCEELATELPGAADDPGRARAEALLLQRCPADAAAGRLGLVGVATLETELRQAMADGALSTEDMAHVEARYDELVAP